MAQRFSERHGYAANEAPEITVRQDAPQELRGIVADIAYEAGLRPGNLRSVICRLLRKRENPGNWSDWPNIANEAQVLLDDCAWFEVYDTIEALWALLEREQTRTSDRDELGVDYFTRELNGYFLKAAIGWQLVDGRITVRGPEIFEDAIHSASRVLEELNRLQLGTRFMKHSEISLVDPSRIELAPFSTRWPLLSASCGM